MTDPAPAVHLHAASLDYGGEHLFDALDVTLPSGRISCLLGPSGVGKSSLLRLVVGLADGASGRVVDGDGRPLSGRLAYMAQQDLLLPWLDVLDNVTLGDRLRGHAEDRDRAAELLRRVGLAGQLKVCPAALSGGMRQRAALARTLYEDRPLVLMDEPFSSLDAITRLDLQDLAAELLLGRTVLLVTHDPLEALRLGHRVLVMSGRPARLAAPLELSGEPPRPPDDPTLLAQQADLLARLASAHAAV